MANRYIQKVSSVTSVRNLPTAAGIGFVNGQLYINGLGGPVPVGGPLTFGAVRVVDAATSDATNDIHATIAAAITAATAGDVILIKEGGYNEAITVSKRLTLVGLGGRGATWVAPTTTNATAITVTASDVTLINLGGDGDGTGYGLLVQGSVARFRAQGCKFEDGAAAVRLESTATGAVSDIRFDDCEFAWSAIGLETETTGAGDPVTNVYVGGCLFHNCTTDCVKVGAVHADGIWIVGNVFAGIEGGTEPTQFIDMDTTSTTGFVAGNLFATTVFSTAKFAIADGVLFANNISQAENPSANVGGASGRPD